MKAPEELSHAQDNAIHILPRSVPSLLLFLFFGLLIGNRIPFTKTELNQITDSDREKERDKKKSFGSVQL